MATPVEIAVRATGAAAASRAIGGVDSKTSRLGNTLRNVAKAGALALGAGMLYAGKKMVDFTQAAIEDEAAQKRLATTLKNTTGATNRQVAGVEKWITKQGKLLGVADDELRPALQRMAEGTGSVTKAQRMVSLAMDVSAGTGKSLKSVTEALLRAQNGSVGGLSRYGIKTKDAAGETLSFERVVKGMADTFGGQAAKQADTLEGKIDRLKVMLSEAGETLGSKLIPYVTRFADYIMDDAIPAATKWWRNTEDTRAQLLDTAGALKDDLIPPLKQLIGFIGDAVGFFGDLPAPIRSFGAQAAAAALILPRLNTALVAARGSMAGLVGSAATGATRMAAIGRAARTAGGVGGMLLLQKGAQESNTALKTLENVGGGAMLGFAVGGPIGGAIGAGAGLLGTLWAKARAAHNAFDWFQKGDLTLSVLDFKDALNEVTGALTRQGREMILLRANEAGVTGLATRMGVAQRDLVGAVNGNEGATRRLNRAYAQHKDLLNANENVDFATWLRRNTDALADQREETRANHTALVGWDKALKGLPPKVQTEVKAIGADISRQEMVKLDRQYGLTPKQKQTIIKAIGTEETIRKVNGVYRVIDASGRVKADLSPYQRSLVDGLNRAGVSARRGVDLLNQNLTRGTAQARPNLDPFTAGLATQLGPAKARASSGGLEVGNALEAGVIAGFASTRQRLAGDAYTAVSEAVANAHRAARSGSPSRAMWEVGRNMGDGLVLGMAERRRQAAEEGARLVRSSLGAATGEGRSAREVFRTVAAQGSDRGGGTVVVDRFPDRVTLIIDGQPVTALVRREIAADQRWRGRMDDRD